jgi:hypothetical protein
MLGVASAAQPSERIGSDLPLRGPPECRRNVAGGGRSVCKDCRARRSRVTRPDTPPPPDVDPGDPRWRPTPTKFVVVGILLIAIVVPLLVSTYARIEPRLFGFPFFYWYQLAWVFLAAGLCALSFLLLKRERDAYARSHPRGEQESAQ